MRFLAGALYLALWSAMVVVPGCNLSAPEIARKTVTAADEVQVSGMQSFVAFNAVHEEAIAGSDKSLDERKAEIVAYRKDRDRILLGFRALASASHAAAVTIIAYEHGSYQSAQWGEIVQTVLAAAQALRDAAEAVGLKIPGLDALLGGIP